MHEDANPHGTSASLPRREREQNAMPGSGMKRPEDRDQPHRQRAEQRDQRNADLHEIDEAIAAGVIDQDRKSVVSGQSVSVRVDLGGGRINKKKKKKQHHIDKQQENKKTSQ